MENKFKKNRFDIAYKARIIVFVIFFIMFTCVLIFHFRVFKKFGKTQIIYVESLKGDVGDRITYVVNDKEYIRATRKRADATVSYEIGEYIYYQISDPNVISDVTGRNVGIISFTIVDLIILGLITGLTIKEFKKRDEKIIKTKKNLFVR